MLRIEPGSIVTDRDPKHVIDDLEANDRLVRGGVAQGIVQGLLHDAVDGQPHLGREWRWLLLRLEMDIEPGALHLSDVALNCRDNPNIIEIGWTEREDNAMQLFHGFGEEFADPV